MFGTGCLGPCPLVSLSNGRRTRSGRNCARDEPRVTCGIVRIADVTSKIGGAVHQAEIYGATPRFRGDAPSGESEHAFGAGLNGHPRPRDEEKPRTGILCGRGEGVRIASGGLVPFDSGPNAVRPRIRALLTFLLGTRQSTIAAHASGVCRSGLVTHTPALRTRAFGSRHRIAPVLDLGPISLVARTSQTKLALGKRTANEERVRRQKKTRRQAQPTQPIRAHGFGPFTREKGRSRGELHICTRKPVEE